MGADLAFLQVLFRLVALAGLAWCVLAGCSSSAPDRTKSSANAPATVGVSSPDFADGAAIPARFTCDGANVSPALRWSGVPDDAATLALVVDDPDAPGGTFTHWVVVDIDPTTGGIADGAPPPGAKQVPNSVGKPSWLGPCPPSGTHHYRFTVYALSRRLDDTATASLDAALSAIQSAATAQGRLVGTYHRS